MIIATLLSSFLAPVAFSAAIVCLTAAAIVQRGMTVSALPLPTGTNLLLGLWFAFASLAVLGPTFNYGYGGQNVDALKFFFVGLALALGILIGNDRGGLRLALPFFVTIITLYYGYYYFSDAQVSRDAVVYPPDNNNSAVMLALFLPIIVLRMRGTLRLLLLGLLLAFAVFVASRTLLALTVLAMGLSLEAVRERKLMLFAVAPLCLAILFFRGFSLNNFSDQLRLQILTVSYNYAMGRGFHAFNFGEAAFTDYLNIYPIYRRVEIEHAHNIVLQLWVAYGWVPLLAFVAWLANFARLAWRDRNLLLILPLILFLAMGMIEAIITDVRSFSVAMFLLGYSYARGYRELADGTASWRPGGPAPASLQASS